MLQSYEKANTFARYSEKISQKKQLFFQFADKLLAYCTYDRTEKRNKTGILLLTTKSVIETCSQPLAKLDD